MSKTIKVSQENHEKLEALMKTRESFDDVVTRLIDIWDNTERLLDVFEGSQRFREKRRKETGG